MGVACLTIQLKDRKEEAAKRLEEIESQLTQIVSDKDAPSLELPPELQEYTGPPNDEMAYMKWEVLAALCTTLRMHPDRAFAEESGDLRRENGR